MLHFGTDGVRGDADRQLTPAFVEAIGRGAVAVFGTDAPFAIGRDTRQSGPRIERDITRGIEDAGGTVESLGVVPTPAVAFVAQQRDVPGVVISASHNPYHDNGIKLFAPGGVKLSDGQQQAIEMVLDDAQAHAALAAIPAPSAAIAAHAEVLVEAAADARAAYAEHLLEALDGRRLDGLHVVLDCANGAAFEIAPKVFRAAGARVDVMHDTPDGTNINTECGSTDPRSLQREVCARGAALGLAFDGDADRCIAVDELGAVVDGDKMMVALAIDLAASGALAGNAIVVTVLSNLGLHRALGAAGIGVVVTPVGDRHVFAAMETGGYVLGGEQSGHIIVRERATTGDGTLVGLLLADLVQQHGGSTAEIAAQMVKLPQVARNVSVARAIADDNGAPWRRAVATAQRELGDRGRVLVRPSGTEPVVRVMVEAPTTEEATAIADEIAAHIAPGVV
ncbi:MAG TPA: phosphoglucosamine mutase [Acidimicrobiia bacterium]